MNKKRVMSTTVLAAAITALVGGGAGIANATVRERALEVINEINDDAAFRALYPPE